MPIRHFLRKKSYLEAHPDTVQAFVNALQRGMEKVSQSTPEEIAKMIALQFPETDEAVLTAIVRRYVERIHGKPTDFLRRMHLFCCRIFWKRAVS